jgi:hypothetical protein
LRCAGDRDQRDTARLENPRHRSQRRPEIKDELKDLSQYHAVEGAIGNLSRIDQIGNDRGLAVVRTDVRYD